MYLRRKNEVSTSKVTSQTGHTQRHIHTCNQTQTVIIVNTSSSCITDTLRHTLMPLYQPRQFPLSVLWTYIRRFLFSVFFVNFLLPAMVPASFWVHDNIVYCYWSWSSWLSFTMIHLSTHSLFHYPVIAICITCQITSIFLPIW